jgi:hypothetical protein
LNGGVGVILVVVVKATMGHRAARSNDDARSLCWSLLDQRLHDVLLFFFPSSLRSIVSSRCERSRYLPHLVLLLVLDALLEAAKVHRQAQPSRRLSEEAPPPPPPPPSAAAGGARGWLALPLPFSSEEYLRTESMDEERGRLGSEVKGGGGETREVGRMGVDDKEGANTGFSGRGSWLG